MKKFSFKLEKLHKIKEHLEQIAKERYASELQKKIKLDIENQKMDKEIYLSKVREFDSSSDGQRLDYNTFSFQERYITGLNLKIEENIQKVKEMTPTLEKLKEELTIAMRNRKTMDKLKEKEHEKYRFEFNRYQTKILDDIAGQRQLSHRRVEK